MHGNDHVGTNDEWHNGDPTPCWHHPLGSTVSARLLVDLVAERLRIVTGSDHALGGDGAVEVDVGLGVVRVRVPDRQWSATLAPLAAQLAHTPPDGWSSVVDREVERWQRAAAGIGPPTHSNGRGRFPPDSAIVLRLTTADGAPCPTARPAFDNVAWELVRDLGAGGRAVMTIGSDEPGAGTERYWDRIAAETVARYEKQWARLPLDRATGVILSGPHVSALLYDPDRLRHRVEEQPGRSGLRVGVITNSLMLIMPCGASNRPTGDVVTDSLRRFASGPRRHFDPFTVELPDTDVV